MKKTIVIMICLLSLVSFCSCGGNDNSGSSSGGTDTAEKADEQTAAVLSSLLAEAAENYRPGTAGSSLAEIKAAASLLSWYSENTPNEETVRTGAKIFYDSLDSDGVEFFREQLTGLGAAAQQLCGDNAAEMLSSAGCEVPETPWNSDDAAALFDAVSAVFAE